MNYHICKGGKISTIKRIKTMRRSRIFILFAYSVVILFSCSSHEREFLNIEKMQSEKTDIPYEQMVCWANVSVQKDSPWKNAKYKLIHYIDSASCSSCYLQKVKINDFLFLMEDLSNNEFYNVIILSPGSNAKKDLEHLFSEKLIPQTIFIDSANTFLQRNPHIPSETMYHTFLLDENDKAILVGNPITNKKIKELLMSMFENKFGKISEGEFRGKQ